VLGAWESAQEQAGQWLSAAGEAAAGWQQALSWEGFEEWQERHWRAFEERQRRRLAELTDEQRERWLAWEERQRQRLGELSEEGQQVVRREIEAFERWQQQYWAQYRPSEATAAAAQPTCPNCRLSFLMLPLLPNIRESFGRFGSRTKVLAREPVH
jgi:hypothetical protein